MTVLSPEQIQFLEVNRPHYNTLVQAGFLTNIGYDVKEGMLEAARVFNTGYQANLWCGPCVCELVTYVYTQLDKQPESPKTDELTDESEPVQKRKYTKRK